LRLHPRPFTRRDIQEARLLALDSFKIALDEIVARQLEAVGEDGTDYEPLPDELINPQHPGTRQESAVLAALSTATAAQVLSALATNADEDVDVRHRASSSVPCPAPDRGCQHFSYFFCAPFCHDFSFGSRNKW